MNDRIYPINGNPTFYTFLHDDFREVVCKRDYTGRVFIEGNTYKYRKAKHEETLVDIWVVWSGIHKDPHYFIGSNFSNYFYLEQIIREEKLNQLGIV